MDILIHFLFSKPMQGSKMAKSTLDNISNLQKTIQSFNF